VKEMKKDIGNNKVEWGKNETQRKIMNENKIIGVESLDCFDRIAEMGSC
jgi:hypothetical protein